MSEEAKTIEYIKSFGLDESTTQKLSAGYDVMKDAGYSDERIEQLLGGALRAGLDPEAMARGVAGMGKVVEDRLK